MKPVRPAKKARKRVRRVKLSEPRTLAEIAAEHELLFRQTFPELAAEEELSDLRAYAQGVAGDYKPESSMMWIQVAEKIYGFIKFWVIVIGGTALYFFLTSGQDKSVEELTRASQSADVALPFATTSNGNAWNSATFEQKKALCKQFASLSDKGRNWNFYYDALDAFYSSSDRNVLSIPMREAFALSDSAPSN